VGRQGGAVSNVDFVALCVIALLLFCIAFPILIYLGGWWMSKVYDFLDEYLN
jgi:hypothetical protein